MYRWLVLGLAIFATAASGQEKAASVVSITFGKYETFVVGPPEWRATVAADGRGAFYGLRGVRKPGLSTFWMRGAAFAEYRDILETLRPIEGDRLLNGGNCGGGFATDQSGVDVVWTLSDGTTRHLDFNYGCSDRRFDETRAALQKARNLLPIKELIG